MHDAESASLRRAAILLLAVSLVRWGATQLRDGDALRSTDVLAEHAAATDRAADEGDRRRAPLTPGERIDPNRADEGDLDRLPGIGPATAAAIVSARDSGLVFRGPDDLLAVRGIGPALLERIGASMDFSSAPAGVRGPRARPRDRPEIATPVDLNRADVDELQRLPGIGPALAARIVEARRERPFDSLDDLRRVSGIGSATVERLRGVATGGSPR